MNAHRDETVVSQDRTLTLEDLPFQVGELVKVIMWYAGKIHQSD